MWKVTTSEAYPGHSPDASQAAKVWSARRFRSCAIARSDGWNCPTVTTNGGSGSCTTKMKCGSRSIPSALTPRMYQSACIG